MTYTKTSKIPCGRGWDTFELSRNAQLFEVGSVGVAFVSALRSALDTGLRSALTGSWSGHYTGGRKVGWGNSSILEMLVEEEVIGRGDVVVLVGFDALLGVLDIEIERF